MKLEYLYKVGSECELNSWPESSVGLKTHGLKTPSPHKIRCSNEFLQINCNY